MFPFSTLLSTFHKFLTESHRPNLQKRIIYVLPTKIILVHPKLIIHFTNTAIAILELYLLFPWYVLLLSLLQFWYHFLDFFLYCYHYKLLVVNYYEKDSCRSFLSLLRAKKAKFFLQYLEERKNHMGSNKSPMLLSHHWNNLQFRNILHFGCTNIIFANCTLPS